MTGPWLIWTAQHSRLPTRQWHRPAGQRLRLSLPRDARKSRDQSHGPGLERIPSNWACILATSSDFPNDGWAADDRFDLAEDMPEGASRTLTIQVRAPATPGAYVLRHRSSRKAAPCATTLRGSTCRRAEPRSHQSIHSTRGFHRRNRGAHTPDRSATATTSARRSVAARAGDGSSAGPGSAQADGGAAIAPASETPAGRRTTQADYQQLVRDVREIVCTTVPAGAGCW